MEQMLQEPAEGLAEILGDSVTSIVLYGSVARGSHTEESDIDVAVFLDRKFDIHTEDKMSDFIVDMDLKYDKVFSVVDIENDNFQKWKKILPFYQNIEREGVVLWKAA